MEANQIAVEATPFRDVVLLGDQLAACGQTSSMYFELEWVFPFFFSLLA